MNDIERKELEMDAAWSIHRAADYPPACRACAGTGKEPVSIPRGPDYAGSAEVRREWFIRSCRAQSATPTGEADIATLFGHRLDALDPEALLWAARALGAMYARAAGLSHAPRTKE